MLNVPYVLDTRNMEYEPSSEWETEFTYAYIHHSVRENMPVSPNSLGPIYTNITTAPVFHVTLPNSGGLSEDVGQWQMLGFLSA